jgi:hypothetical protein
MFTVVVPLGLFTITGTAQAQSSSAAGQLSATGAPPWVYIGFTTLVIVAGLLVARFVLRRRRHPAASSPSVQPRQGGSAPAFTHQGPATPITPAPVSTPAHSRIPEDMGLAPPAIPAAGTGAAGSVARGAGAGAGEEPEKVIDPPGAELAVGEAGVGTPPSRLREPTPHLPRLSEEETRWLAEEYRRVGPQSSATDADLGTLGVLWYYRDLWKSRGQEVESLRTQVESRRGTTLHQKVRGLEEALRVRTEGIRKLEGIVADQARTIENLKVSAAAAEALVGEKDRGIESLSRDLEQLHQELDRDHQTITDLSAHLEGIRVKMGATEGEARYQERMHRLFTNDEIAEREAQLAILLMSA